MTRRPARISRRIRTEPALRRAVVEAGRRLRDGGLVTASDGNISVRLTPDRILITPASSDKARMVPADLMVIDLDGNVLAGRRGLRPSTETPMHLEVYRLAPSAGAVVHAHPPFATALTVAGIAFPSDLLPEIAATLGPVPTTRLALPGTEDDAEAVRPWLPDHRAILLPHHGALTYGESLDEALVHLERVEHAARVFLLASTAGRVRRLPKDLLARLESLRAEKRDPG